MNKINHTMLCISLDYVYKAELYTQTGFDIVCVDVSSASPGRKMIFVFGKESVIDIVLATEMKS